MLLLLSVRNLSVLCIAVFVPLNPLNIFELSYIKILFTFLEFNNYCNGK